jgi:hypothetical protein
MLQTTFPLDNFLFPFLDLPHSFPAILLCPQFAILLPREFSAVPAALFFRLHRGQGRSRLFPHSQLPTGNVYISSPFPRTPLFSLSRPSTPPFAPGGFAEDSRPPACARHVVSVELRESARAVPNRLAGVAAIGGSCMLHHNSTLFLNLNFLLHFYN